MTAVLPTQAEVRQRNRPLHVVDGLVVDGPFAGATATDDMRWDCLDYGRRCFKQDGWWVHQPECDRDVALPPAPLPLPGPYEARQIEYQELVRAGHFDTYNGCADVELLARQRRAHHGADAR